MAGGKTGRKQVAQGQRRQPKLKPKPKRRMLQSQERQQEPARSSPAKENSHSLYVSRILRQLYQDKVRMSGKARKLMKSFVTDLYRRVSIEAEQLRQKGQLPAVGSSEIHAALERVIPEQLAKHTAMPIGGHSS